MYLYLAVTGHSTLSQSQATPLSQMVSSTVTSRPGRDHLQQWSLVPFRSFLGSVRHA